MRVFTAVPLPKDVKDKFTEITRGKLPVPYVNATNLHITLNFLGELDSDQFEHVKEFWTKGLPKIKKFRIEFERLAKHRQQMHMVVKDNPELFALQGLLQKHFESQGYKFNYPKYYAHVTLGNLHMDKVMHRERKLDSFPHEELDKLAFDAERIVIYESKLLLHHAQHIELAEHKLE